MTRCHYCVTASYRWLSLSLSLPLCLSYWNSEQKLNEKEHMPNSVLITLWRIFYAAERRRNVSRIAYSSLDVAQCLTLLSHLLFTTFVAVAAVVVVNVVCDGGSNVHRMIVRG